MFPLWLLYNQPVVSYIASWETKKMLVKNLWQVHVAAVLISLSVATERIDSLLTALNNLESNICTFFLRKASCHHLANKSVFRGWEVCLLPLTRFPVALGGLLHLFLTHIGSTSLSISQIDLLSVCCYCDFCGIKADHICLQIWLSVLVLCSAYCNIKIAAAGPWAEAVNKCLSPSNSIGSSDLHRWERHSLHCVSAQNRLRRDMSTL